MRATWAGQKDLAKCLSYFLICLQIETQKMGILYNGDKYFWEYQPSTSNKSISSVNFSRYRTYYYYCTLPPLFSIFEESTFEIDMLDIAKKAPLIS